MMPVAMVTSGCIFALAAAIWSSDPGTSGAPDLSFPMPSAARSSRIGLAASGVIAMVTRTSTPIETHGQAREKCPPMIAAQISQQDPGEQRHTRNDQRGLGQVEQRPELGPIRGRPHPEDREG